MCIISPLEVEQAEKQWLSAFQTLPKRIVMDKKPVPARFNSDHLGISVAIQGLESSRHLLFSFAMPNVIPHYQTKPLQLLTKLLNLGCLRKLNKLFKVEKVDNRAISWIWTIWS